MPIWGLGSLQSGELWLPLGLVGSGGQDYLSIFIEFGKLLRAITSTTCHLYLSVL